MRTRTNLHIDDVLAFASQYATAREIKLGVAINELFRRAKHIPEPPVTSSKLKKDKQGFLVVKGQRRGHLIGNGEGGVGGRS